MATKSETNFIGPKNHVVRRRSLSRRRIVQVTLLLHTSARSVSTAGSDAIPRLVQLLCGSTITRSVRDEELGTNEGVREKDLSESS